MTPSRRNAEAKEQREHDVCDLVGKVTMLLRIPSDTVPVLVESEVQLLNFRFGLIWRANKGKKAGGGGRGDLVES